MASSSRSRSAWVQLYEARNVPGEIEVRSPGRPPAPIPRHKVGFTLSTGEVTELTAWQVRVSKMLGRKASLGETIGILTRICSARFSRMEDTAKIENLAALVDRMIGSE